MLRFRSPEIARLHHDLGVTEASLENCVHGRSQAELDAKLDAVKKGARERFQEIALECHPDRCDDVKRHEYFKRLSNVYTGLMNLRVKYQGPRVMRVVPIVFTFSGTSATATNSATSGWGWSVNNDVTGC